MNRNNYRKWPVKAVFCLQLMLAVLPSCTDDPGIDGTAGGKGETATLELSLSVPPMLETKAVVCEADSASEARKAGFYYEMQVLTTDTTGTDSLHVATKAATSLKNVYAFLFKSDGTFNGRASLSTAGTGSNLLVFSNIADASAANGRLVIIANDNATTVNYASSTAFASFSGTYAAFQNLTLTSAVTTDVDIPYVGSAAVSLSGGSFTSIPTVQLYRMLAKIVLTNTFYISGGPSRGAIILYKAGNKYFGTPNNEGNGYDGTGTTVTASGRYLTTATFGSNANSNTWYVGENVQVGTTNAVYIRLSTEVGGRNTSPDVGQEYCPGYSFTYDVYLNDKSLRRNNIYNITVSVSGTVARQNELASSNAYVNMNGEVNGGLNIGRFGGATGYTQGTGDVSTISGSYKKYLLLQPNTSGTTATDNLARKWSNNTSFERQSESRKYWDHTYTLECIDYSTGLAYDYCYNLTIGGVAKGAWYLPSLAQLIVIRGILSGLKANNAYADYNATIENGAYWSTTEQSASNAITMFPGTGRVTTNSKADPSYVRCVRDLP